MKKLLTLLLLCCSMAASGQYKPVMSSVDPVGDSISFARVRARMDSIRQYRPTVAVVLGGGGARGMAHLGVLRLMEELGIPIDLIGGTSMGGLVAGLYSFGYGQEYLDSLVRAIDWSVMMSDRVPDDFQSYRIRKDKERFILNIPFHYTSAEANARLRKQLEVTKVYDKVKTHTADMSREAMNKIGLGLPDGFLFGLNVRNMLSSLSVGYQDSLAFDRLPIPFYCVATDMVSMKEKNWTDGTVVDAMRSTMAIPFYFRPVRIGGMILSDGGTRNNFPADIARAMGADIVIGSEMPSPRDLTELNSMVSLAMQNITMMSLESAAENRKHTDILLQHTLEGYNMLSFDSASVADIIRQGYELACQNREAFEAVARRVGGAGVPPTKPQGRATDINAREVLVSEVRINGVSGREQQFLLDRAILESDKMYGRADVERILSTLYGTRAFESVTYHFEGTHEPYTLVFDCEPGQVNEFAASLHIDNDEVVYAGLRLGIGTRKLSGWRFVTEAKIGNAASLDLDFSHKFLAHFPSIGIHANMRYLNLMYTELGFDAKIKSLNTKLDLYLEDSRMVNGRFRLGVSAEMEPFENFVDAWTMWKGSDFRSYWLSAFGDFRFDNLDDGYFPNRGISFGVKGRYVFKGYSVYLEDEYNSVYDVYEGPVKPYFSGMAYVLGAIPLGARLTLLPSVYLSAASTYSGYMNFVHTLAAGGSLPSRYLENQLPFFGYSVSFHQLEHFALTPRLDLRYQFGHANYASLQAALLMNASEFKYMFRTQPTAFAVGVEYARKTVIGPLRVNAHWCDHTGFGLTLSFGYDF